MGLPKERLWSEKASASSDMPDSGVTFYEIEYCCGDFLSRVFWLVIR